MGGPLAEFNSLEVGAKILYRALVLRFGNIHPITLKVVGLISSGLDFIFAGGKLN